MAVLTAVEQFAYLHRGGWLAECPAEGVDMGLVGPLKAFDGTVRAANGERYVEAVAEHLNGYGDALGVYPLFRAGNLWQVHWLAVDLDGGDGDLVHARNLQALLRRFDITGVIETSRSKGFHVWVYLSAPISARVGRNAMIGACRMVDVPITEVYPKQVELADGKIGNCLRLPYPHGAPWGRQCGLDESDTPMLWDEYVEHAMATAVDPAAVRQLLPLHAATEPAQVVYTSRDRDRQGDNFTGLAAEIWDAVSWPDRSQEMCTFAMSLLGQGFTDDAIIALLYDLDTKMSKYVGRPDRERRIRDVLQGAKATDVARSQ